jgi:hypothetical protein
MGMFVKYIEKLQVVNDIRNAELILESQTGDFCIKLIQSDNRCWAASIHWLRSFEEIPIPSSRKQKWTKIRVEGDCLLDVGRVV